MILLYHLIFPDDTPADARNAGKVLKLKDFKRHITWLNKYFNIVSLKEHINLAADRTSSNRICIAITFDDGYQRTFDLISPFLVKEEIPVTFFVTTSHLSDDQLLWFVYFNALCFEKTYPDITISGKIYLLNSEKNCYTAWRTLINLARHSGDAIAFSRNFSRDYPLPESIVQKYLGLTEKQISEIGKSPFLALGGHTHHHPYLNQISQKIQYQEMLQNKQILERLSGKPVEHFAYTGGVYNMQSITAAKEAGFHAAFAVNPRRLNAEPLFEIPRTDIYSPSLLKLTLKVTGIVNFARRIGYQRIDGE